MILTEGLVKKLGFDNPEDAIGKTYKLSLNSIEAKIIGVVNDFHSSSLHDNKSPVIMLYWPGFIRQFVVKINSENVSQTLTEIEKAWKEIIPNYPYTFNFLDKKIDDFYKRESQMAETISIFAFITLVIGCLGLFGLSSFSVEQKTKEIGIRKVVGASASKIVILLNKQFIKLVVLSNLIAWPVAYYLMDSWLQNFSYKISLGFDSFIISALLTLLIAGTTVSFQTVKAANVNPVKSLKCD